MGITCFDLAGNIAFLLGVRSLIKKINRENDPWNLDGVFVILMEYL